MENKDTKMTMMKALRRCLGKKYMEFSGRASRSEFWYYNLATILLNFLLIGVLCFLYPKEFLVDSQPGEYTLADGVGNLIQLLLFLPSLSVAVRRLHDIGKSGWTVLWNMVPLFGMLYLIYLHCLPSQAGSNEYGPQPPETVVDSVS